MTPSSPALCTEHSWSALPIIRYINYDLWLLKALKCSNRCSPVTFSGPAGSIRRPISTSALVLDRQSRRPLLSARPGASHSLLCPKTPWTGESQSHNISFPLSLSVLGSLLFRISVGSQAPCTLDVFLFPGVSSPRCSVLPYNSHPEPWGPSTYFLPGRRLGTRLGRSRVCRAELRPDPSGVSPNPHCQNHAFRGESQAGLQRQLPAEWEQKHKGKAFNLAEVTEFGLVF